jgi:hypothetical protein
MGASAGLEISIEIESNIYQFCFYFLDYTTSKLAFGIYSVYIQRSYGRYAYTHKSYYTIRCISSNKSTRTRLLHA